jgi:hypothetical protein
MTSETLLLMKSKKLLELLKKYDPAKVHFQTDVLIKFFGEADIVFKIDNSTLNKPFFELKQVLFDLRTSIASISNSPNISREQLIRRINTFRKLIVEIDQAAKINESELF